MNLLNIKNNNLSQRMIHCFSNTVSFTTYILIINLFTLLFLQLLFVKELPVTEGHFKGHFLLDESLCIPMKQNKYFNHLLNYNGLKFLP